MERVTGIEPVSSAWKADIIAIIRYPLIINMLEGRLELPRPKAHAPKACVSTNSTTPANMV